MSQFFSELNLETIKDFRITDDFFYSIREFLYWTLSAEKFADELITIDVKEDEEEILKGPNPSRTFFNIAGVLVPSTL